MAKLFYSTIRNYMTWLKVSGKSVCVKFKESGYREYEGIYRCTNEKIAEALRKHYLFGRTIYEKNSGSKEKQGTNVEAKEYKAVYPGVSRTQEANRILVDEYGIDKTTLKSKKDAIHVASELGIHFPDLK